MSGFGVAFFAVLFTSLVLNGFGKEHHVTSKEDDLEMERQLKIINKPALKIIKTEYGDIIDCVDIYKQPAFDHPLLKNHKIQKSPSYPLQLKKVASSRAKSVKVFDSNGCPSGTVSIRRTTKSDLIRFKLWNTSGISPQTLGNPNAHFSLVTVTETNIFKGASAYIDAYNPTVGAGQISGASIWIEAGPLDEVNSINVGWVVDPTLYGDKRTRLSIHWTGDGYKRTGCFDIRCPGFVQVDKSVTLGLALSKTSTIGGDQYAMVAYVYQDNRTGNWWFVFTDRNVHVGYWPKEIFKHLAFGASNIMYGGRTKGKVDQASPPMGSGLFPRGDYYRACFFEQIQYLNKLNQFVTPSRSDTSNDKPKCYGLDNHGFEEGMGYTFLFGGPGGQCGN